MADEPSFGGCVDVVGNVWRVGEVGYQYDPASRGHWPFPDGNHTHYLQVQQAPNGDCFWVRNIIPPTMGPPPEGIRQVVRFR